MALRLLRGKDGRLTAYAPVAGGIARWTEERPGGPRWTGPRLIEVPGLTALTVAQGADGYAHLVGLRHRQGGGDGPDVDVVHAIQFQTGRPLTAWHSLGTPHPKDRRKAQRTGAPTAAVDSAGAVHVFVRNAGRGVSARRQDAKGKWGGWTDLKGTGVLDGLSATATADGRVELLAPAGRGALRWYQPESGAAYERADDIPARPEASSAAAVASGRDTVTHYWRDAEGRGVLAWRPGADEAAPLGGETGTGPVTVVRTTVDGHDCTVLAHRDAKSGRLGIAAHPTDNEAAGVWWTPSGEAGTGWPALALDGLGLVVLAAPAPDGGLLVARQKTDEPGLALRAWGRVGE
ncbi:hypothetical protein [Streptomyces sp. ME19-01-6]|uniref:hypothetical protein n=1 Tax=Streptomyces sp. ME19-01-6 TaxID=3028686 RepID=UPI0029AA6DB4|nr:hypothetical protein [Streptomyces sp. ME19-01-6]MDX3231442.1 hypothetical protein [Streptomyces sp. ME19-01-6]